MFAPARPPASAGAGSSGASAFAPNQDGCATRFAQTVLARVVDSVLRLHCALRVLKGVKIQSP